ncbi:MAG: hypothetical protein R2771_06220 [Saprospiraceae bacterium]
MIKTGKAKYFMRAREGVDLDLVKEKYAEFLKKPNGTYGNLKEIANNAVEGFKSVFGKESKEIIGDLKNGDLKSLNRFIFLKEF